MKNLLKISSSIIVLTVVLTISCAFTLDSSNPESDNKCTVTVKYKSGSLAKSVKVTTEVSGGLSCCGGRKFYTDSYGKVTLEWSSGCYLRTVYVNGTSYKVDYKDGGDYTLTIN